MFGSASTSVFNRLAIAKRDVLFVRAAATLGAGIFASVSLRRSQW
jgi:hypothetical protein